MSVLRMPFFNRSFDPYQAPVRPATAADAFALRALAQRAQWSYLTSTADEFPALVQHDPTMVLLDDERIVAAAQVGWQLLPNAWLRTVLVDNRVNPEAALGRLLPALHRALPTHGVTSNFATLDTWSDPWLRAPLEAAGYRWIMDVWGYAKHGPDVPSYGNQVLAVRRATERNLQAVLAIDAACFPTPWAKGAEILQPALVSAPYFTVAEFNDQIVGYSYVSLHRGGWQAHLVRIAVAPAFQGVGVGVRLLADVVRFCRHRRIDLLTLNTQAANTHAQRLYEWFGFERTGEVQTVLGIEDLIA
jgi:ribosomal protein S18 acetylase RimI-like enzyme